MKQTIRWVLAFVAGCVICSLVTYRLAHHRGYEAGYRNGVRSAIGLNHFSQATALIAALQKLRAGEIESATRFLEKVCFGSAHIFYKDPKPRPDEVSDWGRAQGGGQHSEAVVKEVARQIAEYRATYRTNSAEWDDMERKLDGELATMK